MTVCSWFYAILMVWEFAGATAIIIYGVEDSDVLINELNDLLMIRVYDWDENDGKTRVFRQIMEYVSKNRVWFTKK